LRIFRLIKLLRLFNQTKFVAL
jgi:hypothetical protein